MDKLLHKLGRLIRRYGTALILLLNIFIVGMLIIQNSTDVADILMTHHRLSMKKQDAVLDAIYKLDENVVKGVNLTDRAEVNNINQISKLHGDLDKLFQVTTSSTEKQEKLDKLEGLLEALQSDVRTIKSGSSKASSKVRSSSAGSSNADYRIERILSTGAVIRTPGNSFFIAKKGSKTPLGVVREVSSDRVVIGNKIIRN